MCLHCLNTYYKLSIIQVTQQNFLITICTLSIYTFKDLSKIYNKVIKISPKIRIVRQNRG